MMVNIRFADHLPSLISRPSYFTRTVSFVYKCNGNGVNYHHSRTISLSCKSKPLANPFIVLGIETSCDDTSVAILQRRYPISSIPGDFFGDCEGVHEDRGLHSANCSYTQSKLLSSRILPNASKAETLSIRPVTKLLFHKTISSDNRKFGGIHPLISLESHRTHLAQLVKESLCYLPMEEKITKPDLIAVTRGPGMRSSLAVGLDTAKGLSVAWGVPLVGVNHMLGHALTPRLVSALERKDVEVNEEEGKAILRPRPNFPFLTLLATGGHTMLLQSNNLTSHRVVANTIDLAIGDMLDKCARVVLPKEVLAREQKGDNVMYGRLLEEYVFPNGETDWHYFGPKRAERELEEEMMKKEYKWWPLPKPFESTMAKHNLLAFSFTGLGSVVERVMEEGAIRMIGDTERRALGREVMKVGFEHLGRRVFLALKQMKQGRKEEWEGKRPKTLVVSGGVASNKFLRHMLKEYLSDMGYSEIELIFPPPSLCTDNAAMIAWAGLEMYENCGWQTELDCHPLRKWSLGENEEGGGIFGVGSLKVGNGI